MVRTKQVHIRDVHVRYEDDVSFVSPRRPFAAGFSIDLLTGQTCDDQWTPKFVTREQGQHMAFKVVELHNMAFYLDTQAEMFGDLPAETIMVSLQELQISSKIPFLKLKQSCLIIHLLKPHLKKELKL